MTSIEDICIELKDALTEYAGEKTFLNQFPVPDILIDDRQTVEDFEKSITSRDGLEFRIFPIVTNYPYINQGVVKSEHYVILICTLHNTVSFDEEFILNLFSFSITIVFF